MTNKCTLIIDGNWFTISRGYRFIDQFKTDNSKTIKEQAKLDMMDLMARSIRRILYTIPCIDNIIIVGDGGSWRKDIPVPKVLGDITYKGNRDFDDETDWTYFFTSLNEMGEIFKDKLGGTISRHYNIEGDDWIFYWTRELNKKGINTIIWSSDADLKQLVQVHNNVCTVWFNDQSGFVLPTECKEPDNPMEYFMHQPFSNFLTEYAKISGFKLTYIDPMDIVLGKTLMGDQGDNVKPVAQYHKNGRTYSFSKKDFSMIKEDLGLNINIIQNDSGKISDWIIKSKKFKPYHLSKSNINDMLKYNLKMVWLNKQTIPQEIQNNMAESEYNVINVQDIKNSYHVLLPQETNEIEQIFNEINVPF